MTLMEIYDAVASSQLGLVTRQQLLRLGLTLRQIDTLLRSGALISVHPGVYRCSGTPLTPVQAILAAVLAAGPQAIASHFAAAYLHGVIESPPRPVDVLVPMASSGRVAGAIVHKTRSLDKTEVVSALYVPTTDPCRTILDVASRVSFGRLGWMIDRGLTLRVVSCAELLDRVRDKGAKGWTGAARLRELIAERWEEPGDLESDGERGLLRLLISRRFPRPEAQYVARDSAGVVIARPDFGYGWARLTLDYLGKTPHANEAALDKDQERHARLVAAGYLPMYATSRILRHPEAFLAAIRQRLIDFGHRF